MANAAKTASALTFHGRNDSSKKSIKKCVPQKKMTAFLGELVLQYALPQMVMGCKLLLWAVCLCGTWLQQDGWRAPFSSSVPLQPSPLHPQLLPDLLHLRLELTLLRFKTLLLGLAKAPVTPSVEPSEREQHMFNLAFFWTLTARHPKQQRTKAHLLWSGAGEPCSGIDRGVLALTRLWLGSCEKLQGSHRVQEVHTLCRKKPNTMKHTRGNNKMKGTH